MPASDDVPLAFDLFISYAHADDRGEDHRKVSALVEAIRADYLRVAGVPLRVLFDVEEIRSMDDWESRILLGLRQSKMMVAVLSPAYFRSDYCRREWETYVETELAHALPGDGIAPIYVVRHPDFDAGSVEDRLRHWVVDLKRRQYVDWLDFWPEGASALERADVRRRLDALPVQIAERLRRAEVRERSPHRVPMPSVHFVGRRDEMHRLRLALLDGQIGAITAVHGIAGMGKSMLAFAYAWGYGFEYPGGRFLINAADLSDLAAGMIALAEPRGVTLGDEERKRPELALARVKKAFEDGPPALIVIDNLDDPSLLSPQSRERCLPRGHQIHVLATTRVSPQDLPRIHCLPLDALEPPDALALLHGFRPIADSPQDDEWKAALEIVHRLGGHALAVEVAAVYLRENPEVSCRQFASTLESEGVSLMEEEVGPEARGRLAWHAESCIARLLEPTLAALTPEEWRAVEYAAQLPPDNVPFPWLRDLLLADFPDLARSRLGDRVQALFRRLERFRLVVPQARDQGPAPTTGADPGESRLARMHRLVQDVVRRLSGAEEDARLQKVVTRHASDRANWMNAHWGVYGLAWELLPLRDVAIRIIDRGDRDGVYFIEQIAVPLVHIGRMLDARNLWVKAEHLLKKQQEASPENDDYARVLSISYDRLGDLAVSAGDAATARRHFEAGLAIRSRLSEASPENAQYARDLSVSFDKLGNLAVSAGDAATARRHFEAGLAIRSRLSEASPENADYARDLSVSFDKLGNLAVSAGDAATARRHFEGCLAIARRLSEASPENAQYTRDLSVSYIKLGNLAVSAGDAATARRHFEAGLAIRSRLSEASPENAQYARDLWVSYWKIANLLNESGSGDENALAWWRRAWETLAGMKRRGIHISPGDEQVLHSLEDRFGFGR